MKTDSIFYRLFQEFPSIFFEIIGNPPTEANTYNFSSVEIKQTAFRMDGVFLPVQGVDYPEEIEAMFGLSELKQTRVYQEALHEGIEEGERRANLKAVPRLLELGLSVEQIAEALGLKLEEVRQATQNQPSE